MSERVQVTVGKTPDGMYVMHEYALTALIKQAQDAQETVVAQAAQIAAALALHPVVTRYGYCEYGEECDTSDQRHVEDGDGELVHLDEPDGKFCGHCETEAGLTDNVPWPCPTARALGVES